MRKSAKLKTGKCQIAIQSTTQPKIKRSIKLANAPVKAKIKKKWGCFLIKNNKKSKAVTQKNQNQT